MHTIASGLRSKAWEVAFGPTAARSPEPRAGFVSAGRESLSAWRRARGSRQAVSEMAESLSISRSAVRRP
jgi:hypothetical protein